jgi:hypothetical protein
MDRQPTESAPEVRARENAAGGRVSWIGWLQAGIAGVAVLLCLRGQGHHSWWMALVFLLPAARLVADRGYRQRVLSQARRLWGSLQDYPSAGRGTPWLATLVFVVVPSGVLFLSNDRTSGSGDTWPVLPTACSLVTGGHWDVQEYVPLAPSGYSATESDGLPYCVLRRGAGIYSGYPAGMVQFALPAVAFARLAGADLAQPRVHQRLEKWTAAWVAACALGLFFLIALHLAPPVPAWLTTAFLAAGSVMFSTCSQGLWQQGGLIFWLLLALFIEFRRTTRPSRADALIQGLAGGMMLACRLSASVILVPLGLWVLWRSPRRAVAIALVTGLAYVPWAWMYLAVYGNAFGPSTAQLAGGNWTTNLADSLAGVLVSPGRGLVVYQPWLLLGLVGCLPGLRRRPVTPGRAAGPAGWQWVCLTILAIQVALVAAWRCWWGGHCWGSRLVAEVVPLGALLCVRPIAALGPRPGGWVVLAGLALLSFGLHATGVYTRAVYWDNVVDISHHPEQLWCWSRPPFLAAWQRAHVGNTHSRPR